LTVPMLSSQALEKLMVCLGLATRPT
jgi:hypothetical protein